MKIILCVDNTKNKIYQNFQAQRAILICTMHGEEILESLKTIEKMANADFSDSNLFTVVSTLIEKKKSKELS